METKEIKEKDGVGTPFDFTYVIDSDAKLDTLIKYPNANTYTFILIKRNSAASDGACTADSNKAIAIDFTASGIRRIVGEPGSKIKINFTGVSTPAIGINGKVTGTYPNFTNTGPDYSIDNVTLECTAGSSVNTVYAFNKCSNVTNCSGKVSGPNITHGLGFGYCDNLINCVGDGASTGVSTGYGYGFYYCTNLINCDGKGTGTASGTGYGRGFCYCTNLVNCTGTGTGNGTSTSSSTVYGYGYGFYYCNNLTNCNGTGTGESSVSSGTAYGYGYGFTSCRYLVNCTGTGSGTGSSPGADTGIGYGFNACRSLTNCAGSGTGVGTTVAGYGFYNCHCMTLNGPSAASTSGGPYASNCTVGHSSGGIPADTATGGWNRTIVISPKEEEAEREHESPMPEPAVK